MLSIIIYADLRISNSEFAFHKHFAVFIVFAVNVRTFSFLKFVFAQFQHICSANLVRQIYLTCAFSCSCKACRSVIIFSKEMKSFVYFYFKLYDQIEGANIFFQFFMPPSGRFFLGGDCPITCFPSRKSRTVCGYGPFVPVPLFFV